MLALGNRGVNKARRSSFCTAFRKRTSRGGSKFPYSRSAIGSCTRPARLGRNRKASH